MNHHDISDRGEFVDSFKKILQINLYTKLNFLTRHGFSFFSIICDRRLRNAIAHHDFKIGSNGEIILKDREITRVELVKKINDLLKLINIFFKHMDNV